MQNLSSVVVFLDHICGFITDGARESLDSAFEMPLPSLVALSNAAEYPRYLHLIGKPVPLPATLLFRTLSLHWWHLQIADWKVFHGILAICAMT